MLPYSPSAAARRVAAGITLAFVAGLLVANAPIAGATPIIRPPVIMGDWPDPEVVRDPASGRFYSFATNFSLYGDWWNVPVRSSADLVDWTSAFAGDALPALPVWADEGQTWAPGVARIGNRWVLYFTAQHAGSSRQCIGVATATQVGGPYVSRASAPLVCQLDRGGSIDPSPTRAPDGSWWLTWKSDDNALGQPTHIWSSQLSSDGLGLVGATHHLLAADHPREAGWGTLVIEGPDLVLAGGRWWLFYGGGQWNTDQYFINYAACDGPAGPCTKQGNLWSPWLDLSSGRPGPGGPSLFADTIGRWYIAFHGWVGAVGYPFGARATHIEPVTFDGSNGAPRLRPDLPRLGPLSTAPAWLLRNTLSSGVAEVEFAYGVTGDRPLTCDWDGDGTDTPGVHRPGVFYLRNSNTTGVADIVVGYGDASDIPVCGDWDGNGTDTIGIFRNGVFYLRNSNTTGVADLVLGYGSPGDAPVVGDWDGNGTDTVGVHRPGVFYLRNSNTTGVADLVLGYGGLGDTGVVGDWDGDGSDGIGVYREA